MGSIDASLVFVDYQAIGTVRTTREDRLSRGVTSSVDRLQKDERIRGSEAASLGTAKGLQTRCLNQQYCFCRLATKMAASAKQQQTTRTKGGKTAPKRVSSTGTDGAKKRRRRRRESYSLYVFKVLKQVHPDTGISGKAMAIMNSFVSDILDRIGEEASKLAICSRRSTVTAREIQTVTRLLLPGELARHAVSEGTKAVSKYTSSQPGLPSNALQQPQRQQ
ncbi:hypothetical protein HPB50_009626 [Hyalomma asiaticum]|uniref:Uncharacterized protein n=1 Tax=Hyalomma asiaticum TaxID=266040 RepID=A0ACB7TDS9_HYAAI|nr:hypothetical protein HPB50_009626 [Hyalomma asiaticum]